MTYTNKVDYTLHLCVARGDKKKWFHVFDIDFEYACDLSDKYSRKARFENMDYFYSSCTAWTLEGGCKTL